MHPVIRFNSKMFDVSIEPENPINPIRGSSLLAWLRERMPQGSAMSEPAAEDWGWYSHLDWHGRTYLIGSSANEEPDGDHEWVLQIEKSRSLRERLLGRAKMTDSDPCFQYLRDLMAKEPSFANLMVELGP